MHDIPFFARLSRKHYARPNKVAKINYSLCRGKRMIMSKFDAHSDFGLYAYNEFLKSNNNLFLEKHYDDLNRAQIKI